MNITYINSSIRFNFDVNGVRVCAICHKVKDSAGTWQVFFTWRGSCCSVTHIGSTINALAVQNLILKHLTI